MCLFVRDIDRIVCELVRVVSCDGGGERYQLSAVNRDRYIGQRYAYSMLLHPVAVADPDMPRLLRLPAGLLRLRYPSLFLLPSLLHTIRDVILAHKRSYQEWCVH